MKANDLIKKEALDVTADRLIEMMGKENRQVDLTFENPKTDADGYLTWDAENWTSVDGRRFIRCFSLAGRTLRDSTTHNIYDMKAEFHPENAKEIKIN